MLQFSINKLWNKFVSELSFLVKTLKVICKDYTDEIMLTLNSVLYILFSLHKKWSFPFRISSVNVIFSKFLQKLRIWSHLLKKSLMENFIFCVVFLVSLNLETWEIGNYHNYVISHLCNLISAGPHLFKVSNWNTR